MLLRAIERQTIVVCFDVAHADGDVFTTHPKEGAYIDDHRGDSAVAVENQVLDAANIAILHVIDRALPTILLARIWSGWMILPGSPLVTAARVSGVARVCAYAELWPEVGDGVTG